MIFPAKGPPMSLVAAQPYLTCSHCGKHGNCACKCRKRGGNNRKPTGFDDKQENNDYSEGSAESKGTTRQKWSSVDKMPSRSDQDCYKQGAPRPPQRVGAFTSPLLYWVRAHVPPTTTRSRPSSLNFDDDFGKRFAFTGLLAGSGQRGFHPNSGRFTIIVERGASDHFIDDERIRTLRNVMRDPKKLKDPKTMVTVGNEKVFAAETGAIWGYIIDHAGQRVSVRISITFVPGLGRIPCSIKATQSGLSTILEMGNPQ